MNGLGVALRSQGKYQEAAALLSKILEIRHRQLGPDQPDTLFSRNSLALVYDAQGRYDLSEPLLIETLEGRRRVLGAEHPLTVGTMNNLAESYRRQGKLEEAQSLFEEVLSLRRRVLTPNNVSTLAVLVSLGEIKFEQRDHDAAQKYLGEALSGYEMTKSETWRRYYAQSMLGASLAALGRPAEAEPLITAGYEGMLKSADSIPLENRPLLEKAKAWVAQVGQ
jgi:eukaryotic-like serine/threonine-protein kinase